MPMLTAEVWLETDELDNSIYLHNRTGFKYAIKFKSEELFKLVITTQSA